MAKYLDSIGLSHLWDLIRSRIMPPGGSSGQILAKESSTDYDVDWVDLSAGNIPVGGDTGQVLTKMSSANHDVAWEDDIRSEGGTINGVVTIKMGDDFPTETPSENTGEPMFFISDSNGDHVAFIQPRYRSDGWRGVGYGAARNGVHSSIAFFIDDNGFPHVWSETLGVRKSANANKTISSTSIDTYTNGPSVSLEPGKWAITGQVNFNTGESNGTPRNIAARFKVGSTLYAEQQRVVSASNNWAALNVTMLLNLDGNSSNTTVTLQGSSNMKYTTATTWYIVAQRIG